MPGTTSDLNESDIKIIEKAFEEAKKQHGNNLRTGFTKLTSKTWKSEKKAAKISGSMMPKFGKTSIGSKITEYQSAYEELLANYSNWDEDQQDLALCLAVSRSFNRVFKAVTSLKEAFETFLNNKASKFKSGRGNDEVHPFQEIVTGYKDGANTYMVELNKDYKKFGQFEGKINTWMRLGM